MSDILGALLNTSLGGEITRVLIGLHWTAVVTKVDGQERCGLASTLRAQPGHQAQTDIPQAGQLASWPAAEIAELARSDHLPQAAVGVAALNALLPPIPKPWKDLNAEEVLATHGAGKTVALIGHFPFISRLYKRVGRLQVLEKNPRPGDMPADAFAEVLPYADVVAITGTTLINHTLEGLLAHCSSQALVVLLGPSAPLSPILFDHGIDIICGSIVTDITPVLRTIEQGGNFRQVHRAGICTVAIQP